MATNVKPQDLNYDHYSNDVYDRDIQAIIPGHRELHQHIKAIVKKFGKERISILELGTGTGLTAECILKVIPNAKYLGIDFSRTMLNGAKRRLKKYNAAFVLGDYAKVTFPKKVGLVISVIGIHHQTNDGKRKLFKKIHQALNPNGIFLFGDLVTFRNPKEVALNDAKHYAHLVRNARDEQCLKDWAHHHKFLNIPAPLEDLIAWLEKAGFRDIKVAYRKYNTALIYAKK